MSKPKRQPPVDVGHKPVLEVQHHSYQPSKKELEADVSIDATPDELAKALIGNVAVRSTEPRR